MRDKKSYWYKKLKDYENKYLDCRKSDEEAEINIEEMTRSDQYKDYKRFLSNEFFDLIQDYFTSYVYQQGTASQNIDEVHLIEISEARVRLSSFRAVTYLLFSFIS